MILISEIDIIMFSVCIFVLIVSKRPTFKSTTYDSSCIVPFDVGASMEVAQSRDHLD